MVARSTAALSAERTLPGRFVFSDLRPDRSARDRGMDSGGSPPCPFPIADAQVHLDADAARRVVVRHARAADKRFSIRSRPDAAESAGRPQVPTDARPQF